jgi:bacterioferritin (cytochrome b1)
VEVDRAQLWALSYYRASELTGALLMGRLARKVTDPVLMAYFTEQCAEEARHAWLWTETILSLGGTPLQLRETHQSMYVRLTGYPTTLLDILACTKVFEERVHRYFMEEAKKSEMHPVIKQAIETILHDEVNHIAGVDRLLAHWPVGDDRRLVDERIRHYREIDEQAYQLAMDYRERPWELLHVEP